MSLKNIKWENVLAFLLIIGLAWNASYEIKKEMALQNSNLRAIQRTLETDTQNLEILEKKTNAIEDKLIDGIYENKQRIGILEERTKWLKKQQSMNLQYQSV